MTARLTAALLAALLAGVGTGVGGTARAQEDDAGRCQAAVQAVEAERVLPPRLLDAISLVESGRPGGDGRGWAAWPWTVNVHGAGRFYATQDDAVAAVGALLAAGDRAVDVGCMQVNLAAHPDAFATLRDAFDPVANVRYAAGFLQRLYDEVADWTAATAAYHSRTPGLGAAYAARVAAVLDGGALAAAAELPARLQEVFGSAVLVRYAVALPRTGPVPVAALTVPLVRTAAEGASLAVRLPVPRAPGALIPPKPLSDQRWAEAHPTRTHVGWASAHHD